MAPKTEEAPHLYRFWPVVLADLTGLSALPLGLVCAFVIGLVILATMGAFTPDVFVDRSSYISALGTGTFFTLLSAYSIAAIKFVIDRQRRALDGLRTALDLSDERFTLIRDELSTSTRGYLIVYAAIAIAAACVHLFLLALVDNLPTGRGLFAIPTLGSTIGTLLVWFVVTHVIAMFIENAITIAKLAEDARVDVLQPQALDGFGTIALLPTLGLLGMQMLYPLLSLGGFNAATILPGFLLTLVSLIYLFVRPLWPLHKRIARAKAEAVAAANERIAAWQSQPEEGVSTLQPLLDHRAYLLSLSEWPFTASTFTKWLFYLIVPLAAWISSAFVEIFIEGAIG